MQMNCVVSGQKDKVIITWYDWNHDYIVMIISFCRTQKSITDGQGGKKQNQLW